MSVICMIGVVLCLAGIFVVVAVGGIAGPILLCIGVAAALIGFLGIVVNMNVEQRRKNL